MSKSRLILRIILGAMLIGVVFIGYYQWRKSRPDFYYSRAEAAIEKEDYESARINLVKLLQRHPDNADGHALLSRVILSEARANRWPTGYAGQPLAAVHLERAVELRPGDDDLRRRLLRAYLQLRFYNKAAVLAEDIFRKDPTNGDAHFALTWRAVNSKDAEQAEQLFAAAPGVISQNVFQEFALKILLYTDLQDHANLRLTYVDAAHTAARLTPDELRALTRRDREVMLQVLLLFQANAKDTPSSLGISRVIVDVCEKMERANMLPADLIGTYSAQSQAMLDETLGGTALTEYQREIREQMTDQSGRLALNAVKGAGAASSAVVYWSTARGLMSEGKFDEALETVEKGIAAHEAARSPDAQADGASPASGATATTTKPPSADLLELYLLAARLNIFNQKYDAAEEQLDKLRGHDEFAGWAHLLRGNVSLREGRQDEALEELKEAERTLGDKIQVNTALARAYLSLREWKLALPYLESLLVPEEKLTDEEKDWRVAIIGFEERVHMDMLRARLALGQWDEAQDHLRALRDTEWAPQAWNLSVAHLWETKQHEKAWEFLRRCRELFPNDVEMVFLEANFLLDENQSAAAERAFQDFVDASPNDAVRRLAMARWLIRDSKPDTALRMLETLQRHGNLTNKARNTLKILQTQALIELKRNKEADVAANALIENPETGAAGYLFKAVMAWNAGDKDRGAQLLAQARAAEPRDIGPTRKIMRVLTPEGYPVGVEIQDAYYW